MKGLSSRATPHRGKFTYPPLYDRSPPHTAQTTRICPSPTARIMTWPSVSVKEAAALSLREASWIQQILQGLQTKLFASSVLPLP
jgi:hypothetical protein